MRKQAMLILAWLPVAALGVLIVLVALRPQAVVAGRASEGAAPAGQKAAVAAEGIVLSAASYEGLPVVPGAGSALPTAIFRLYVPDVATGNLTSTLYMQNPGGTGVNVVVLFYAADGEERASEALEIPAHGSRSLEVAAVPGLPVGFEGSAILESDGPIQAVANLKTAAADSLLSYGAVPGTGTEAILLGIARNYAGWNTSFWVQNAGTSPANVAISYRSTTGFQYNTADTIPASASHVYRQADMPPLGDRFMGYALVTADEPIGVVVELWHSATALAGAYNGSSPAGTGTLFLFPRQQKAVAGWNSAVQIMNVGSIVADVTATWYSGSGSLQETVHNSMPPGSLLTYALAGSPTIPSGFDGSGRVAATELLAAIANSRNQGAAGDGLAVTTGLSLGQLATSASLPRVAHVVAAGLSTELSIQNASETDAAAVSITFYDQSGAAAATVSGSLPPNGVARYDTAAVPELGSNWQGSAIVEADQLVAVEVMQVVRYVPPPCDTPLTGVSIDGPTIGDTGTLHVFTAVTSPVSATLPLTYTWAPVPDSGQATSTAEYTWDQPGAYSLTVTAENCGGLASASHLILVGSVVTTPVDPGSGGSLVYTDTEGLTTTVQVPAGAVNEPIDLVYLPQEPGSPPAGFAFAGQGFHLEAFREGALIPGFVFSAPVTITIHYSDADVAGVDEESLALTYWTGSEWEDAACGTVAREIEENWLAVPICHLTEFGLLGETRRVYLPLVVRAAPAR